MRFPAFVIVLFMVLTLSNLFGQELAISMKKYPVTRTFGLGERGLLLYGEDPNKNSNQKELVLVKGTEVDWYSQCMPSSYNVIPVYSNESNYIYFVEEGYVKGGNLGYIFMDNSGTSRKGKVNISLEMRKIDIRDASKLDLIQMHSAKEYLVLLFAEKSGSEITYYALFVAHATQRVYPVKLIHSSYEAKDKFKSALEFLGTCKDKILLAQRVKEGDFQGFYISEIDPKAGTDETRKIAYPIAQMAHDQKVVVDGSYYSDRETPSPSNTVKTAEYLGDIQLIGEKIYIMGVEYEEEYNGLRLKTCDADYKELLDVRIPFDADFPNKQDLEKFKNGSFGFELFKNRNFFMGAMSSKKTILLYIDINSGKLVQSSFGNYDLEELSKNAYYLYEDLRKKKFAWFQGCHSDFYSSADPIFNKMEFKIYRSKL